MPGCKCFFGFISIVLAAGIVVAFGFFGAYDKKTEFIPGILQKLFFGMSMDGKDDSKRFYEKEGHNG